MEIIVVLFVLVLFTAMIAPNLISMRNAQRTRAAYGQVQDLISQARLSAVSDDLTYAITWDSGASSFDLKKEPPNQNSASSSAIPDPEPRPMQQATTVDAFEQVKSVSLPSPLQAEAFRVGTNESDAGSWAIHFYPDGTSDGGGFEVASGSNVQSLTIDTYGIAISKDGPLPETTDVIWPAGTYAQKI